MSIPEDTDDYFMDKMREVLWTTKAESVQSKGNPTKLSQHLYIGSYDEAAASNINNLQKAGITRVVNMAAFRSENPYPSDSGIEEYLPIHADDSAFYDIIQHFSQVKAVVDRAKSENKAALVHCAIGSNRSGAMCVAYLMVDEHRKLLKVLKEVKQKRKSLLSNNSFRKQLIHLAREKGLLL